MPDATRFSELNSALLAGRSMPVRERTEPQAVRKLSAKEVADWRGRSKIAEGVKAAVNNLYEAKIGQADKVNQNGRVYPADVWRDQLDHYNASMLKSGYLCGAVDHLGDTEGGNLRDTCIIHRELSMDDTGAVWSKFEVVKEHSVGADLQANLDAGMAIGFSTFGYGSAHEPSESECAQYGLNEDDGSVIMNRDYALKKADAVDDPSVADARVKMDSRRGLPAKERVIESASPEKLAEACATGLHWKEIGKCGHILSQCECAECDEADKHSVYTNKLCEKCKGMPDSYSVDEFKQVVREGKDRRPPAREGREPLAKTFTQYVKGRDSFEPTGPITLAPDLSRDAFNIVPTWGGVRFERHITKSDDLYHFAGSATEAVLKEIDDFFGLKEEYEKYGVMFHRGVMMHGPPGCGKTSAVNQVVDLVTARGDVVFYGRSVGVLREGLNAFREVEPDRKVVVVLEDADEYVGYQEREMLNLLDGADTIEGVLYLGSTNYLNRFPERLLRPGRFDKKVFVGPPPIEGRKAYLSHKLGKVESAEEIDRLAAETQGLSFGHLRELITAVYALKEPKAEVLARLKGARAPNHRLGDQSQNAAPGTGVVCESNQPSQTETAMDITTLNELQAKAPKVHAEHLAVVGAEKAKREVAEAQQAKVAQAINPILKGLKELTGVELPQREVLPAEFAERQTRLESEIGTLKAQNATLVAEKAAIAAELETVKSHVAKAERTKKVMAKANPIIKDNAYAEPLKDAIREAINADATFDESKVEAFIDATCVKFDKISGQKNKGKKSVESAAAPKNKQPSEMIGAVIGDDELDEIEESLEDETVEETEAAEPCAELALAFGKTKVAERRPAAPAIVTDEDDE